MAIWGSHFPKGEWTRKQMSGKIKLESLKMVVFFHGKHHNMLWTGIEISQQGCFAWLHFGRPTMKYSIHLSNVLLHSLSFFLSFFWFLHSSFYPSIAVFKLFQLLSFHTKLGASLFEFLYLAKKKLYISTFVTHVNAKSLIL